MTRDVTIGLLFSLIFHGCVLWYVARIQHDLVPPQPPPPILNLHLSSPAPSARPASLHGHKADSRSPSVTQHETGPLPAPVRPESQKERHTVSVKSQVQREKRSGQTVKVRPVTEQTPRGTPIGPPRVIAKAPETPIAPQGLIDQRILLEETVGKMPQPVVEKARLILGPTPHEKPIRPPRIIDKAQETPIATHGFIDQPILLEKPTDKMAEHVEEKGRPVLEYIPQTKAISPPKAIRASLETPIPIHGFIQQRVALEETFGGMRTLSPEDKGIGTSQQAHASSRESNDIVEAKPNYAVNPKPLYPKRAIRRGYEGTVTLLVEVLSDGSVRDVEIFEPSGYPILDRSALKTVRTWRFIPGKRGNDPVTMKVKVPVVFKLKKAKDG